MRFLISSRTHGRSVSRLQVKRHNGSGFVYSHDGFILTNSHVVHDADKIEVTLFDGCHFPARVVDDDPDTDLAAIRIDATDLVPVRTGDSRSLKAGLLVVTIGNPNGFSVPHHLRFGGRFRQVSAGTGRLIHDIIQSLF